jgi:hypothetical protein
MENELPPTYVGDMPLNVVPLEDQLPEELFVFDKAKKTIDDLFNSFSTQFSNAQVARSERYVDLDVESMRRQGVIDEDETFIPDRVINTNIARESGDILAFLNAGFRLAIFDCVSNPEIQPRKLEFEFTKGLTYKGWYDQFKRVVDGSVFLGRDYLEVTFDETKPLHVGFEHVGFDKVVFNPDVSDIQESEWLVVEYEVTPMKLESFVKKHGFNPEQVSNAIELFRKDNRQKTVKIRKAYFKYDDCVYIAWLSSEGNQTDWMRPPEKLRLGITHTRTEIVETVDPITGMPMQEEQQIEEYSDIQIYPIFTYIYDIDEQDALISHKGRSFLDAPHQEANTALMTAVVNGAIKSAAVYASPNTDDPDAGEVKQLDTVLVPNGIYNRPMMFWSKPAPDVQLLNATQHLDTKGATSMGKQAFAVSNRKDSRKTARELSMAQEQESKLSGVNLASFSSFLRNVLDFAWLIVQSQALTNKIDLLKIPSEPDIMGNVQYVNDLATIGEKYDIRPAGDTDVVEAAEEQQKMMQDWPVIQTTPLASKFLQDFIKLRYPKKADEYINVMIQGNNAQAKGIIQGLMTLLQASLSPEELKVMPPQDQQNLQMMQQQAQQFLQSPV